MDQRCILWAAHERSCSGRFTRLGQCEAVGSVSFVREPALRTASVKVGECWMLSYTVCHYAPSLSVLLQHRHQRLVGPWCQMARDALVFVAQAIMHFITVSEKGAVGHEGSELWRDHGLCEVPVPLASGLHSRIDHHWFTPSVTSGAFDSMMAYLAYPRSVEIAWSPLKSVWSLGFYNFADVQGHAIAELLSYRTITTPVAGPFQVVRSPLKSLYRPPPPYQCGVADALAYLSLCLLQDIDADLPSRSPDTDVHVLGADSESKEDWDLSDILPSETIDVHSSLWPVFLLIQEKCGEYSIDVPSNAIDFFKLELRSFVWTH